MTGLENLRQLEKTLERMALLTEGIQLSQVPEEIGCSKEPLAFKEIVRKQTRSLERELIQRALEDTQDNVTRAAERLGLSRKGLQLKMKELDLR